MTGDRDHPSAHYSAIGILATLAKRLRDAKLAIDEVQADSVGKRFE